MISLKINDSKKMIQALFFSESFDAFRLQEASITKAATLFMIGRIHQDYRPTKEAAPDAGELSQDFVSYAEIRNILAEYMKGEQEPLSFKIVLQASDDYLAKLLSDPAFTGDPGHIKALILTFRFDRGTLTCLTGISAKMFTLDKSIDRIWDLKILKSLDNMQISFDET